MQFPSLPRVRSTFAALAILTLAACGGGGGGSGSDNPAAPAAGSAGPSLGVITNATVNFFQADGSTLIGSSDTGSSGVVTVPVGAYTGPVVIEVLGDDVDAMYFDEAAGSQIAFPSTASMHALAPSPGTVGVTPLTEIAYQAAVNQSLFPISASAVNELNEIVRAALAPGLTSILSVPTLIDGSNMLSDDEAGNYALVLAALAELASSDGTPALTVLNALVADLADGVIDGQDDGTPITVPYANFITEMQAALSTAAGKYGYPMGSDETAQTPASTAVDTSGVMNPDTGGGDGPNGETVPATINAALVGTFDLEYAENAPGAPYADGEMVQVVVGSDSSLQLPGVGTLTSPFFRSFGSPNTAEIIWLDGASNIEYALTNNDNGNFNEINVGDASNPQSSNGIPGFLGQLRMEDDDNGGSGAPPELAAIAGQFMGQIVSKSGTFSQGRSLEDMVLINIDSDSVVTVDSQFVFDPAADSYQFRDNRDNPTESFYRVEVADGTDSTSFDIIFEDASSSVPIAYRLRDVEDLSGGSFRISTLELEERPLPSAVSDFFNDMIADSPVALTAVSVDQGFNSPFAVCDELSLVSSDGSSVNSSNSRTPFRYLLNNDMDQFRDSEIYRRSNTRYASENGDESLEFPRNRIVRRADGFVDFVVLDAQNNARSRATNDPSAISAAGCSDNGGGGNGGGALGSDAGASGMIDGEVETVTEQVLVQDQSGLIGITASQADPQRSWGLRFPASVGSHPCSPQASTFIQFQKNFLTGNDELVVQALGNGAGSCTIVVTAINANSVEGTYSGVLIDNQDNEFPVTNGEFRAQRPQN